MCCHVAVLEKGPTLSLKLFKIGNKIYVPGKVTSKTYIQHLKFVTLMCIATVFIFVTLKFGPQNKQKCLLLVALNYESLRLGCLIFHHILV